MTSLMRTLLLLLLLLAVGAPSAFAAPGDSAPVFDDEDEDEEDEDEDEEDAEEEEAEEEAAPEDEASDEEPEEDDSSEADEDDSSDGDEDSGDDEDYDPLKGLDLPGEDEDSDEASDEDDEEEDAPARRTKFDEPEEEEESAEELEAKLEDKKSKKKRLVKVIQRKFFLKYRRLEVAPHVGYVGNDNFIRRLHLGLGIAYHINDILGIELNVGYMPNLGATDYKPLTLRFQREDEVVPDISRVVFSGLVGATVSPIYGKVELGALRIINYDLFFTAGAGVVHTVDDTAIIKSPCDGLTPRERKGDDQRENGCYLVDQWHFASFFGGGIRIVFNKWIGIKLDVRNITHIEQAWRSGDVGLEMKHSLLVSFGASFFLPPEPRKF